MTAIYPKFRQQLLTWALNASAPAGLAFYVVGVKSTYVYDPAHTGLGNIPAGGICAPETALANVTIVDGVIDADDVYWDTVLTAGVTIDGLIVYLKDGGGNSFLAAYFDTSSDGSLPQLIESTSGFIRWDGQGIFKI